MSTVAKVAKFPSCDFCKLEDRETEARYDGRTSAGPWGFMCEPHFKQFGVGLGTGKGQRLALEGEA